MTSAPTPIGEVHARFAWYLPLLCGLLVIILACFPSLLGLRPLSVPTLQLRVGGNIRLITFQLQTIVSGAVNGNRFDPALFKGWPYDGSRADLLIQFIRQSSFVGMAKNTVIENLGQPDDATESQSSYLVTLGIGTTPVYFDVKFSTLGAVEAFRFRSRLFKYPWTSRPEDI